MANLQVGVAGNGTVTVGAGASVHSPANNTLTLGTNNSERARIDSSGRLILGNNASESVYGIEHQFQIEGTNGATSSASFTRNSNNANPPYLTLAKSRGTSLGSETIVQDDDQIGAISFNGADGTNKDHMAAQIQAYVDGTPGANDMPGRLVFATTADGTNSSTERLRITSAGLVGIGTATPDCKLHISNGSAGSIAASSAANLTIESSASDYNVLQFLSPATAAQQIRFGDAADNGAGWLQYNHSTNALSMGTAGPEKFKIDSSGNVSINDGNLVIGTAGKGIDFSAQTQSGSTTDDEILDHYEKGKWTPVVKKNDVANGTADVIHGRYVRIGKFCWLSMYARWNSGSNAQGTSGGWTIHGLPFSLQDDDPGNCRIYQSAPAGYFTIDGNDHTADDVRWQINTSTYFDLYTHTSSADQAWTTGMMAVGFTGAFMIHE